MAYFIQFAMTLYTIELWICLLLIFFACSSFLVNFLEHIEMDFQQLNETFVINNGRRLMFKRRLCIIAEFYGDNRVLVLFGVIFFLANERLLRKPIAQAKTMLISSTNLP